MFDQKNKMDTPQSNYVLYKNINEFTSPIIPHMQPSSQSLEFGGVFTSIFRLDANQQRIDKTHWICDYSDDIFQTLRNTELNRRLVCFRYQQVSQRPMLLKLLKAAAEKHKLSKTTLHLGEGSKPLFARDDIAVNQTAIDARDTSSCHERNAGCKTKSNRRSCSTESSSPERYRHRDTKKHASPTSGRRKSPERSSRSERPCNNHDKPIHTVKYNNTKTDKYKRKQKSKSRSPSPTKKTPAEKVPYYRDQQREKDRIRRLYGRSRSRTPPSSSAKKYTHLVKPCIESPKRRRRRRSTSRDRHRRHSPYQNLRRDYRSRRSRTRSRTRSPQRHERHKHYSRSSRDRDNEHKEDPNALSTAVIPTTPQFIPIPVAVPADYAAYSFPGWTTPQPSWHPSHHRPPPASHFAPFPMMPMMPPMRPPHQALYGGMPPTLPYAPITSPYRPHAPQRYAPPRHNANNYQFRPKKPSS